MSTSNDVKVQERTDALQRLLRGEIAAQESYDRILEWSQEDPASWDGEEVEHLKRIAGDHRRAVSLLRQHISEAGEEPDQSSGPWGVFARTMEEGARLLGGHTLALKALKEGEVHGVADYQKAMSHDGLGPEVRELLMGDLLPRLEEHVQTLDQVIARRERPLKEDRLRDRIDRSRARESVGDD